MGTLNSKSAAFDLYSTDKSGSSRRGKRSYCKEVTFTEAAKAQVFYLSSDIEWSAKESYSIKLKLEQIAHRRTKELETDVVVGLTLKRVDSSHFKSSSCYCSWNITQGIVNLPEGSLITLDKVKKEGEILIHFIPGASKISLTITNPKDKATRREINILGTLPPRLCPCVGVLAEGGKLSKPVTVSIVDIVASNENDIFSHVSFTKCFGTVDVNVDKRTITRQQHHQGNVCALLPVKMSGGRHRWTIIIHSDYGASTCVGVARYPFKLVDEFARDHSKHVYKHQGLAVYRSFKGLLYKDGREMSYSLEPLDWNKEKQLSVQLELIYEDGKLEILRNGSNMGTAFEGLTGYYQPVVCFYAAYSKKVELKSYFTTESLFDVLLMNATTSSVETDGVHKREGPQIFQIEDTCFDKTNLFGKVHLTEDKKTIYRLDSQSGNAFCFVNLRCSQTGIYRLSFIIEVDQGASTCIGVTNADSKSEVRIPGYLYHSRELYLYRSFQGMVYLCGSEQTQRFEEFWMSGTLVEMEITVKGVDSYVQFKINGAEQGKVLPGLKTPLTPVVAFYSGMEKRVTFLHFEFQAIQEPLLPTVLLSRDSVATSYVLNDTSTTMTLAPRPLLPPIVTLSDAVEHSTKCKMCDNAVNVIALPCKHAFQCSQHISIGLNTSIPRCAHCGDKITQLWNII